MGLLGRISGVLRVGERRRHFRYQGSAVRIILQGQVFTALDWSLGGVRIGGCRLPLANGERVVGTISCAKHTNGEFLGEISNVMPAGEVGIRFIEIDPRVFLALSGLAER